MEAHHEGTWLSQVSMVVLTWFLVHEGQPTPQERRVEIVLERDLLELTENLLRQLAEAVRSR